MKINAVWYFTTLRRYLLFIAGALAMIPFFSCNSTKKVHKGEYLLTANKITYQFNTTQKGTVLTDIADKAKEGYEKFVIPQRIAPSEVLPYLKQKPNTKILFFFPFYLYLYNLPDSANTAIAKARKDSAYIIKARKKGWTTVKLKRKTDRRTGREWIMSQGEAPVILDSTLTQKSADQIKTFLINKGYFNAEVKDSVHVKGKKAEVTYIVRPGKPYKIHSVQYLSEDPRLIAKLYSDSSNSKLRVNEIYDQDNIDAESLWLTTEFNNDGYYYFTKQYINYVLDTNGYGKTHLVNITVNIKKFAQRDPNNKDSVIESNHIWYHIRNVTVQMYYDPTVGVYHPDDTLKYDGLTIVYPNGQTILKPSVFRPRIFIGAGDTYRITNRDDTYTGLSQLDEFTYISIKYALAPDSLLDCYIQLQPRIKHSFGAEFEGTNTGGDLGVQGDISYANYNQFNGADKFQFKLNGGLIAEKILAAGTQTISNNIPLNTIDIGPELDFGVPRPWFPFNVRHFARKVNPQTSVKLTFDYQQRPDYLRHLLGASYDFDFDPVKNRHVTIALFEVNLVNANLTPAFAQELDQYNLFFQNSFKNQVITDTRGAITQTNQDPLKRQKHFYYLKGSAEVSGLDFDAFEHWHFINLPVNEAGQYYVKQLGAPFSQYFKLDGEYRHYWILDKLQKQKIVTRLLGGYGYSYYNSSELPFTKSFWAGGSNDIRAWQIQTLGPGGSSSSGVAGQVGDIKVEGNVEYRVSLIKYFGLAYFIDAGNIWLTKNKATEGIPLSYFQFGGDNSFMNEMAVGTGIGLRFDFNYFVFRLDFGQPLRDPSLSPEHRLIPLDKWSTRKTVLNIGIGYPF